MMRCHYFTQNSFRILPLLTTLFLFILSSAFAAIPVGASGSGSLTFDTLPSVTEWATMSVPGLNSDIQTYPDADMDLAMSATPPSYVTGGAITATQINSALGTKTTSATSSRAYWRSVQNSLCTQPTGNSMTLLMGTFQNTSGGTITDLAVSYTLTLAGVGGVADEIKGHRIYFSKTGTAGSWTVVGNQTTLNTRQVTFNLSSLAWANNDFLYVIWADDNGTSPDGDYTIDNLSLTPFTAVIGPSVTITSQTNSANVGANFIIEAAASTTSGSISSVSFYDGANLLGTDTTSPYTYAWMGAPVGAHALTAVALDSNALSAISPVVNVTTVAGAGTLTRGPYLQKAAPTQMTIRWRNSLQNIGRVKYGIAEGNLDQTVDETIAPASGPLSGFDHSITLSGLSPNTTYFYSIGSADDILASGTDYTFTTPPVPGVAINTRIWVLGDAGTANANQQVVRDAFYTWTGSRTPNLVLQLGDNAYNTGTDTEYQSAVFNIYPTMLRKTPFWSCLGNHETAQSSARIDNYPYFDIYTLPTAGECGGVPSGTEHYYSFNYGNIHFISLDSMTASRNTIERNGSDGPMAAWLRTDLESTTATWIVCFFHHPPYTKGSHDSDNPADSDGAMEQMRTNFLPILEAGGVDLVVNGHSHVYERSFLLDGHYGLSGTLTPAMKKNAGDGRPLGDGAYIKPLTGPRDNFGAVYTVTGSAGQATGGTLNHPAHYISLNNLGSFVFDVNGTRLDATFVKSDGSTPDTFTIIKQGAADRDGDGIPDEFEMANGLDQTVAADALLDAEGDGLSNLDEYIFGLNPQLTDRYNFTTTRDAQSGFVTINFPTIAARNYRVWYSDDLSAWSPAPTVFAGNGSTQSWVDDGVEIPPAVNNKRFYQIRVTTVP